MENPTFSKALTALRCGMPAGPGGTKTLQRTASTQDVFTITDNIERESSLTMCRTSACLPPPNRNITHCTVDNAPGVTARWTGSDVYNPQGIKVAFRATSNASTGFKQARCFIDNAGVSEGYELTGALNVYNATPVLTGISPASITEGQTTLVTFYGSGFGTTPPSLLFSPGSVSYSLASGNTDTQFQAYVTAPSGAYDVSVTSNGTGNGFQQGGGTVRTSPTPRRLNVIPTGIGINVSANGVAVTEGQTIYLPAGDPRLSITASVTGAGSLPVIWFVYAWYNHPQQTSVTRQAYYPNATGDTLPANQTWSQVMSTGGNLQVSARIQGSSQAIVRSFKVLGTNPPDNLDPAQPNVILAETDGRWFWPNILTGENGVVAENGPRKTWRQFDDSGHPVFGSPNGFGIMQVELSPGATSGADQLGKMFNWKLNIQAAKAKVDASAVTALNWFNLQYGQWTDHLVGHGPHYFSSPYPYTESANAMSPYYCEFSNPYEVWSGTKSYVDAITIKMYNGATTHYLYWGVNNSGWYVAPTQLAFGGTPQAQCLHYVKRGCALSFVSSPPVNSSCNAYNQDQVSVLQ